MHTQADPTSPQRMYEHSNNAITVRRQLHHLLHAAGYLPHDADALISALEAGAISRAHCMAIELDGGAPTDRSTDYQQGWWDGVHAVCEDMVSSAGNSLKVNLGIAAASRAHVTRHDPYTELPTPAPYLPHRTILGRPQTQDHHLYDTQIDACEQCGERGWLARDWDDERLPALCTTCHERATTRQAGLLTCETWCGLDTDHNGLCAPSDHRHCPHAAPHPPESGSGPLPPLCLAHR
ncbi:hypothetical protein [Streptomyces xiamenensis]|uniref:hypothetical protein n=1 Tax=Streptomyces xiamenensis TaxID=408015 RepID=UPI0035E26B82